MGCSSKKGSTIDCTRIGTCKDQIICCCERNKVRLGCGRRKFCSAKVFSCLTTDPLTTGRLYGGQRVLLIWAMLRVVLWKLEEMSLTYCRTENVTRLLLWTMREGHIFCIPLFIG